MIPIFRPHPSGRPRVQREQKKLPVFRSPGIGSYIPRLQMPEKKDLIGFRYVEKEEE